MTDLKSAFLKTVTERGYVHQCTDKEALDAALSEGQPKTCYRLRLHSGFAARRIATADYATALVPEIRPQANCPDGWGNLQVGDPSGKDEARQLITEETIATNKAGIQGVFENF